MFAAEKMLVSSKYPCIKSYCTTNCYIKGDVSSNHFFVLVLKAGKSKIKSPLSYVVCKQLLLTGLHGRWVKKNEAVRLFL